MIAAIYARKSNEQLDVSDDAKSVTRQVEHARAYAARKGWTVSDECIYTDDAISGAEFARRPGYLSLMNALKPRAPFDALVMMAGDRLGREQFDTPYALKQLALAGVRVFYYLDDRECKLDNAADKFLLQVHAFADEMEREKARQRTHDALLRKARAGHVTGGVVFGYHNQPVLDGVRRSHVERVIDPQEAAVVRRIFELAAEGWGCKRIAALLNAERALAPKPRRKGGVQGWATSSIRALLHNPIYRGVVVWNRSRKRDAWGVRKSHHRPKDDWVTVEAPNLRIVSDELWEAVHGRLTAKRERYLRKTDGRLSGRPTTGVDSKYLLTGFARCSVCGGSLTVRSRNGRHFFYGCTSYHLRGTAICPNGLEAPMATTDEAVLTSIERDLLHVDVIVAAVERAVTGLTDPDHEQEQRQMLDGRLAQLDKELGALTQAIVNGEPPATLVAEMHKRERDRLQVLEDLAVLDNLHAVARLDLRHLQTEVVQCLEDWTGFLRGHVPQARQILRKLLIDRFTFTPTVDENGRPAYAFEGQGAVGRIFAGLACAKAVVSPTGFEPVFPD